MLCRQARTAPRWQALLASFPDTLLAPDGAVRPFAQVAALIGKRQRYQVSNFGHGRAKGIALVSKASDGANGVPRHPQERFSGNETSQSGTASV